MRIRKILEWAWLIILVFGPIVALLLPKDYFNEGEALCPSMRFFNIECYGCGMTRAMQHLSHLDFESAAYYNPLSFIVAPILAFLWVKWLRFMLKLLILKK
ncbi:MAG: DUF2752 domain-containing protein [Saprospiraceae bacterium]